jgi:hypothetical protein
MSGAPDINSDARQFIAENAFQTAYWSDVAREAATISDNALVGPTTMADRTTTQHQKARSTAAPATEQRFFSAYSDLEPQIRNLTHMAELARFHAIDTFGSSSPDETEEGKRERSIALFAVVHVVEMACDLEKAYDAVDPALSLPRRPTCRAGRW